MCGFIFKIVYSDLQFKIKIFLDMIYNLTDFIERYMMTMQKLCTYHCQVLSSSVKFLSSVEFCYHLCRSHSTIVTSTCWKFHNVLKFHNVFKKHLIFKKIISKIFWLIINKIIQTISSLSKIYLKSENVWEYL